MKRTLAMLLAVLMLFSLLPAQVFAEETVPVEATSQETEAAEEVISTEPISVTDEAVNAAFNVNGWLWPVIAVNAPDSASDYQRYSKVLSRGYYDGHESIDIRPANGDFIYAIRAAKAGTVQTVYSGCANWDGAGSGGSSCGNSCQYLVNGSPDYSKIHTVGSKKFCNWGFGNGVVIDHGDGTVSEYAHMSATVVAHGHTVEQGQIIGYMGSTGASTGRHLHFTIKQDGVKQINNPMDITIEGKWNGVQTISYGFSCAPLYGIGYPIMLNKTFTAPLLIHNNWIPMEHNYQNGYSSTVDIDRETGYANQLWYFEWQTDGSYMIFSCYDGSCLTVDSDRTVRTAQWTGADAQKWYLYYKNGTYVLEPKSHRGYALEVPNNSAAFGTVPVVAPYHGGVSQLWTPYLGAECILAGPELAVTPGTSSTPTIFTWKHSYGAGYYVLKIWKGTAWDGDPYTYESTVTPGCSITLPAGTYQAYVDACHNYGYDMGNLVTFTVGAGCSHSFGSWQRTKAPSCTEEGSERRDCRLCDHYETRTIATTGHTYTDDKDATCNVCGAEREIAVVSVPMHRMYDPNSGEHFYSGSELERDFLVEAGWHYEGVGFNFPVEGDPVHRLYDPVHGEHLYTMDEAEMNELLDQGWQYEGVAFNSAGTNEVPQYRLHNPNAKRGGYHFTGSELEQDILVNAGWIPQGIGWYSCRE